MKANVKFKYGLVNSHFDSLSTFFCTAKHGQWIGENGTTNSLYVKYGIVPFISHSRFVQIHEHSSPPWILKASASCIPQNHMGKKKQGSSTWSKIYFVFFSWHDERFSSESRFFLDSDRTLRIRIYLSSHAHATTPNVFLDRCSKYGIDKFFDECSIISIRSGNFLELFCRQGQQSWSKDISRFIKKMRAKIMITAFILVFDVRINSLT